MFAFIRKHWVAYLIGAAVAVVLGFGVSYVLGVKWSTPEDVRAERQEAYAEDAAERNEMAGDESQNVDDSPTPVHPQSSIQRPLLMLTL